MKAALKKIPKDLLYIMKYSFTVTLAFMFIFITMFNMMTLVQNENAILSGEEVVLDESTKFLLYASMANNLVGIAALSSIYLHSRRSWLFISFWFCFYIGFLLFNVLSGWVVNSTGYLMLFFGIALILTLRKDYQSVL